MPAFEQTFDSRSPELCPAGFWRRVLWAFLPSLKAKNQERWEENRTASKAVYLKKGRKKIARVAVQAMRLGLR
jgi:hypothetical protein